MGNIRQAFCGCGYKEDFLIGAGMLFFNLEVIKTLFDKETAKKIDIWLESHELQKFDADKVLALCGTCGKIEAMPKVTFYAVDGTSEEFCQPCACGASFSVFEDAAEKVAVCPNCKKRIQFTDTGWWD